MRSACFGDLTREFWRKQECPTRVSHMRALQEYPTKISYKNDYTRLSHKNILQECPTRVS